MNDKQIRMAERIYFGTVAHVGREPVPSPEFVHRAGASQEQMRERAERARFAARFWSQSAIDPQHPAAGPLAAWASRIYEERIAQTLVRLSQPSGFEAECIDARVMAFEAVAAWDLVAAGEPTAATPEVPPAPPAPEAPPAPFDLSASEQERVAAIRWLAEPRTTKAKHPSDWILESRKLAAVKIKEAAHVGIWVGSEREDIVTWLQAQAARCSARPEMLQKQLGEELGHAAMMILEGAHRHLAQGLWDKESEWRSADAASGLGEHENMTHRPPRSPFEERAAAARWLRGLESPRSAETAAALTEDARLIERGAHREGLGLPELGATEREDIVAWLARRALSSKPQDLRRVRGIKANEICVGAHLSVQENVGEGDEPPPSPGLEAVPQSVLDALNQYTLAHPGRSAEELLAWAAQIRFTPPHRPAGASAVAAGLRAAQKAGS